MKSRFIVQFSGYHENGRPTEKKYTILNIEGEVTIEIINQSIVKASDLSPFRNKKEIEIYYLQAF
jgi:hypothetical protein